MKKTLVILGLFIAAVLAAAAPLAAQAAATLQDVSFVREEGKVVISIKIDGKFSYETSSLTMPRRLILDLTPVDKIMAPSFIPVDVSGVVSIRAGQYKPQTARLVIDLSEQNPSQSVSAFDGGIKVSFWLGGDVPAAKEPARQEPVRIQEIPREEIKKAVAEPSVDESRFKFFFRANLGLSIFLKPNMTVSRDFPLYGETGSIAETYTFTNGIAFDGSLGKYFRLGGFRLKAGIGFTSWKLAPDGAFTMSLPHPFLDNTFRTVSFSETSALESQMTSFYAYALFPFLDTESFSIFFGPLVGFVSGKFRSLEDWDITEKAPFSSADVTVSNPTFVEDTISEPLFGASLSMELNLGNTFAVVLDTKMLYLNPKVGNLGKRTNLFQLQPSLGFQVSF
ncbi:MAG: AMIN domain-containing protein [Candidatus Aminicenantales bacterium]